MQRKKMSKAARLKISIAVKKALAAKRLREKKQELAKQVRRKPPPEFWPTRIVPATMIMSLINIPGVNLADVNNIVLVLKNGETHSLERT